jgi:putative DNA primase/helicase
MADLFFRGYVETKDKQCIEKFKGRKDFKTYAQVQSLPEYAGILADDTILIDIDDLEQSELLFKIVQELKLACRVYRTTRGKHFLFLNKGVEQNRIKAKLAVGLTADIKLGKKNSYSVLKFGGKNREIIYDTETPQELPKWLVTVKGNSKLIEMEAGDGRNQALFNYILTLQAADFSVEEARDCIKLINRFVLKDPLPESELDVILRDEAFAKPVFFNGNAFLFDKFAVYLKNNAHIVKINDLLHLYDDGIYIAGKQRIEYEMVRHIPEMNRTKRTEVYEYLNIIVRESVKSIESNLIAFRNGMYDILTGELLPFAPEHVITNRIDWDYNPNAACELVDEVLDKISCKKSGIRALLEEVVGYCFYRRNELGKAFIFTGERGNGKSTYLDMIRTLLGKKNISALDLSELNKDYLNAEIAGKLANIGDDIGDEFIPNTGVFKKLVTGDELTAMRKYQDPFTFENYAKLLFSANNIPRLGKGKDSAAIKRRLIIVPFNARFSPDDPDFKPYIKYDLKKQEAMEYLIVLALAGLKRVLKLNKFTESEEVQAALDEYEETNNPIIGFFKEADAEGLQIENEPTNKIFKAYSEYCIRCNLQALASGEFSKQVKRYYGFDIVSKKIQGKTHRIFVKGESL